VPRTQIALIGAAAALSPAFAQVRAAQHISPDFDPAVLAEAETAAGTWRSAAHIAAARVDLTEIAFVTIDPAGSTDLDQAIQIERSGTGYRVRYAIADVPAFVAPGGALDRETHSRATTMYCPDLRVPLHPPVLSDDAASLRPDQERPAFVWTMDLDADGALVDSTLQRAVVRSRAQLEYPGVQHDLNASGGTGDSLAVLLHEVGRLRTAQEIARGGVSLGRPEQDVVARDGGWALEFRAPLPIEDDNAQISLLTGMAAAQIMLAGHIGVLRTMPAGDPRALQRLRNQARALHIPWPNKMSYGDVIRGLDSSHPNAAAFLSHATMLFRGAAWVGFDGRQPALTTHSAIAAPYAHVTAPLRRLVDRYGLETCLALHEGRDVPDWVKDALPALGDEMAAGARLAAEVGRQCTDRVEAAVLGPHVGETFDGVALEADTVQLEEPAVVARCGGAALRPGDSVTVTLRVADLPTGSVRFEARPRT
jgi:VacB/RNase II family 3'-5' exoribonuclease